MTDGKNFNKPSSKPRVLVAPLEWGLGHATRCIPIIRELLHQGCDVIIAAEGATLFLLQQEFPDIVFLPLMGYRARYSRSSYWLPLRILLQFPKFAYTIFLEHRWLASISRKYNIKAVISDNRFGMYNKSICSIYITHQLQIKTGKIFTEWMARRIHFYFIKKYNACWVPDFAANNGHQGLAGELSHIEIPRKHYMGALSRFEWKQLEKKYNILVVISGPEPQRTIFEKIILDQLTNYQAKILFIRGLPDASETITHPGIEIKNHLSSEKMNEAILQSELVISRCGYTTVMDLVKLKKKAILIPTPGQTEQEYLAGYLMKNKIFYTAAQKDLDITRLINASVTFPFQFPSFDMEEYKKVISEFVQSL